MSIKRAARDAILIAVALIIFVVEAYIPPLTPVPGIKLGLANVVTLFAICVCSRKDAAVILILRILLGSLILGQLSALPYSLAGGILCFAVMALLRAVLTDKQIWAMSIAGALAHNFGQLAIAALLTGTWGVFLYAPILIISAVITGAFTGLSAQFLIAKLKNTPIFRK